MLIMQDANNLDIAQVSQEQFDKIMFLINKGQEEGAKLEVGGKRYGNSCLVDQVNANQEVHRHAYVAPVFCLLPLVFHRIESSILMSHNLLCTCGNEDRECLERPVCVPASVGVSNLEPGMHYRREGLLCTAHGLQQCHR